MHGQQAAGRRTHQLAQAVDGVVRAAGAHADLGQRQPGLFLFEDGLRGHRGRRFGDAHRLGMLAQAGKGAGERGMQQRVVRAGRDPRLQFIPCLRVGGVRRAGIAQCLQDRRKHESARVVLAEHHGTRRRLFDQAAGGRVVAGPGLHPGREQGDGGRLRGPQRQRLQGLARALDVAESEELRIDQHRRGEKVGRIAP